MRTLDPRAGRLPVADRRDAEGMLLRALRAYPMDPGLAMHRAAEALVVGRVPLETPILDLGGHDGTFARLALGRLERARLVGCDPDLAGLRRALGGGAYPTGVGADAGALPFCERTFGAVLCNSVLTHLLDLDPALAEIRRILRPGGRLLASVPTPRFHELFGPARLLRGAGLPGAAARLARGYDLAWSQRHFLDRDGWRARLDRAGLALVGWMEYLGPRASLCWSLLFVAARLGVGRLTVGACLRGILPAGSSGASRVERALARWLGASLLETTGGGSAFILASADPESAG